MIEPTPAIRDEFRAVVCDCVGLACRRCLDARLAAVLAHLARDRCMERRGHVWSPSAKRDEPLPLSVGRIQSYCGRVERPHAGHVWTTETGRWCPGDEVRS